MSELSWAIKLTNAMSGPAGAAASSLDRVAQAANSAATATKAADIAAAGAAAGLRTLASAQASLASAQETLDIAKQANAATADIEKLTEAVGKAAEALRTASSESEGLNSQAAAMSRSAATADHYGDAMDRAFARAARAQQNQMTIASKSFRESSDALAKSTNAMAVSKIGSQLLSGSTLSGVSNGFAKLVQYVGKNYGDEAATSLLNLGAKAAAADESLQQVGLSLGGVVTTGALAAAAAVAVVAAGVVALSYKFGELAVQGAVAFTKFATSSLAFRENTLIAFKTLLGTKDAAASLYDKAVAFAAATPFQTNQVVAAYQKLLVGGFKPDELERIMKAVGDVAAMKGFDPAVMDQMITGLAKLRGQGKLTGEVLQMEAFQGISGSIIDQLAKSQKKSADEIRKAMSAGKIDAKTAEEAILEVIRTTYSGGTLGNAMKDFSTTWDGLWSTIASRPSELFQKAGGISGGGLARYFSGLEKVASWIADAFSPESATGQKAVSLIDKIGGELAKLTDAFDGDKASAGLSKALDVASQLFDLMSAFGEGLFSGLAESLGPLTKDFLGADQIDKTHKTAAALRVVADALGTVIGYGIRFAVWVAQLTALMGEIAVKGYALGASIYNWFAGLTTLLFSMPGRVYGALGALWGVLTGIAGSMLGAAVGIGTNIVLGILAGLGGAKGMVIAAVQGLGAEMLAAVRAALGIASPSRKMEALMEHVGTGAARGVQKSAPAVHAAMNDMVQPEGPRARASTIVLPSPVSSSRQEAPAPERSGGGDVHFHIASGAFVYNGGGGDEISFRDQMIEALEEFASQLGMGRLENA